MSPADEREKRGRLLCGVGDIPTEAQFRAAGYTAAAALFPEDDFRAQFHRLVDLAEQALCRMEAVADGYDLFEDRAILEALS